MDSDKLGKHADWNSGTCTAKEMLRLRKLNPWAPEHPEWVVTVSAPSACPWCMHQTWLPGSSHAVMLVDQKACSPCPRGQD